MNQDRLESKLSELVGSLLISGDLETANPAVFLRCGEVFSSIGRLLVRQEPIDLLTVAEELKRSGSKTPPVWLCDCAEVAESGLEVAESGNVVRAAEKLLEDEYGQESRPST